MHEAQGVIVGLSPREELRFGEPETLAYWRSSLKPFQALPLVEDGVLDTFGLDAADLALCCASHAGTPVHVARAGAMLGRMGLSESALACGPHPPFDEASARELLRGGEAPTPLHNNCSGKHAGMLALALHHGWRPDGYAGFDHPVQRRIRDGLRDWLDVDPEALSWATDGCGVPTPYASLRQMARAYARLGRAAGTGSAEVVAAMTAHPIMVGGADALATRMMEATGGRIVAKDGAEGVFCVAARDEGWGAALKVADGAKRAVAPAVVGMLVAAGILSAAEGVALEDLHRPPVTNWAGEEVGRLVAEVEPHRSAVAGGI